MILTHGGIEFNDKRIPFDEWPAIKNGKSIKIAKTCLKSTWFGDLNSTWPACISDTPWGSMPFLKVKDNMLGQSIALSRYAATIARMSGSSDEEAAQMDAIVDAVDELRVKAWGLAFADTDAKRVGLDRSLDT